MGDRLTDGAEALHRVPVPVTWSDVEERAAVPDISFSPPLPPRDGNRRRALLGAAVVVVLIGAVVGLLVARGREDTQPIDSGPGPSTASAPEPTTIESAPSSPDPTTATTLPAQGTFWSAAVEVWTGAEYLVWSGQVGDDSRVRADGWRYDPATGTTRDIPVAPIAPRSGAAGVWTGSELIVCCGQAGFGGEGTVGEGDAYDTTSAAAYDPATDKWRVLAPPPEGRAGSGAAWTGSEMLVLANTGNLRGPDKPALFAYDPSTDAWSTRTAGPIVGQVAWTGDRLVVLAPDTRSAVYDPAADTWSDLPAIPDDHPVYDGSIAWVDDQLVVWGNDQRDDSETVGYRLRLGDDAWRSMAEAPIPPIDWYEGTPGSQTLVVDEATGRLVVYPAHGYERGGGTGNSPPTLLTYDPEEDQWRDLGVTAVGGYAPYLTIVDGRVLVPDRAAPNQGELPR